MREQDIVVDLASYDPSRRENSAIRYSFGLLGYVFGLDLPDEIFHHPVFMEMHLAAADMVNWSNVSVRISQLRTSHDTHAVAGSVFLQRGTVDGPSHE